MAAAVAAALEEGGTGHLAALRAWAHLTGRQHQRLAAGAGEGVAVAMAAVGALTRALRPAVWVVAAGAAAAAPSSHPAWTYLTGRMSCRSTSKAVPRVTAGRWRTGSSHATRVGAAVAQAQRRRGEGEAPAVAVPVAVPVAVGVAVPGAAAVTEATLVWGEACPASALASDPVSASAAVATPPSAATAMRPAVAVASVAAAAARASGTMRQWRLWRPPPMAVATTANGWKNGAPLGGPLSSLAAPSLRRPLATGASPTGGGPSKRSTSSSPAAASSRRCGGRRRPSR